MLKLLTPIGLYFLLLRRSSPSLRNPHITGNHEGDLLFLGLNSIGIITIISFFMGSYYPATAYNMENPIYPTYLIGLGCRDSMILEFSSTIAALILAGKSRL